MEPEIKVEKCAANVRFNLKCSNGGLFPRPVNIGLLNSAPVVMDVHVKIHHAREPHEPGLNQDDHAHAGNEEVVKAVVLISEPKDGHVPDEVEKEEHHGKSIVDTTTIILLILQLLATNGAVVMECEAFIQREHRLIDKDLSFSAIRTFQRKKAGEEGRCFSVCRHKQGRIERAKIK